MKKEMVTENELAHLYFRKTSHNIMKGKRSDALIHFKIISNYCEFASKL